MYSWNAIYSFNEILYQMESEKMEMEKLYCTQKHQSYI